MRYLADGGRARRMPRFDHQAIVLDHYSGIAQADGSISTLHDFCQRRSFARPTTMAGALTVFNRAAIGLLGNGGTGSQGQAIDVQVTRTVVANHPDDQDVVMYVDRKISGPGRRAKPTEVRRFFIPHWRVRREQVLRRRPVRNVVKKPCLLGVCLTCTSCPLANDQS